MICYVLTLALVSLHALEYAQGNQSMRRRMRLCVMELVLFGLVYHL